MNEVGFDDLRGPENYEVLNKINQEFVNLIRSSGGNNPKRHLLIAGYYTDITMTCSSNFKMPDDPETAVFSRYTIIPPGSSAQQHSNGIGGPKRKSKK